MVDPGKVPLCRPIDAVTPVAEKILAYVVLPITALPVESLIVTVIVIFSPGA